MAKRLQFVACERLVVLVAKKSHQHVNTTIVGLPAFWKTRRFATVVQQCRNRPTVSNRMVFQVVSGRSVMARHKALTREYLLLKLREFHRTHHLET